MLPFLLTVVGLSMSGVMMPGPVFAVTVAKSYRSQFAGALVALGHGLVEVPLILLLYFGLISFLHIEAVRLGVSIAGGIVLLFMGLSVLRLRTAVIESRKELPFNSVVAGIATSIVNPYFLLWWATVGAALIAGSMAFGRMGLALLIPVHWLCDLVWLSFVAFLVYRTGRLWGRRVQNILLAASALLLIGFGLWFLCSALVAMA